MVNFIKDQIDRTFDRLESDEPFATTAEDTERMANLAYKYMVRYKELLKKATSGTKQ